MNHAGQEEDGWIFFTGKARHQKNGETNKNEQCINTCHNVDGHVFSLSLTPAGPLQIVTHTASQAPPPPPPPPRPAPHPAAAALNLQGVIQLHTAPHCFLTAEELTKPVFETLNTNNKLFLWESNKISKLPADKLHIPPLICLGCHVSATVFTLSTSFSSSPMTLWYSHLS